MSNTVVRNKTPAINPAWTFTLWLAFQETRKDEVGSLARRVAQDVTWPGWRDLAGLEAYLRAQGADEQTNRILRQAFEEWKTKNGRA